MPEGHPTGEFLKISLQTAVPLWQMEFQDRTFQEILAIAKEAGQFVAEHGDDILFKSPKKGATAAAFNALAKGIAALSFMPGGVTTFGMHFEEKHRGEDVAVAAGRPVNLTFKAGTLGRFILKHGLSIKWREVAENPAFAGHPWSAKAKHYVVDIEDAKGKLLVTHFSKGLGLKGPPTLEEVIGSMGMDAQDYEREPDNPELASLGTDAASLRVFLGKDAYKELLELVESG